MYRGSDDGLRPSCTGSYGEFAATLDASRSQVAEAIKWLKAREWLDVLIAGPRGGVYAVQWPRIEEQVSEEPGNCATMRKEAVPQPKAERS
jgi:DNA-binding FadR family transcriptional regulator